MKMDLQDMKKKFDERCDDFKRQLQNFKNNNEAIEALKKAHAKELAAHVQEHNRKYNELLQQKMDSEDALKEAAEKERKKLLAEAEQKLRTAIEETKKIEQANAQIQINKVRTECDQQITAIEGQMKDLQAQIQQLQKELKNKDYLIQSKDEEIAQRGQKIQDLQAELDRMR